MVLENVIKFFLDKKFWISLIILIVFIIVINISKKIVKNKVSKSNKNTSMSKKKNTYILLINKIFNYLLIGICILLILEIYGFDVTKIFAGLGIVSVITGLALQDALKDIIMGFNIIADDYYSVGDTVIIGDLTGQVVEFSLKSTKIRDAKTNNIVVIANRNIDKAAKVSNFFDINLGLEYDEKLEKIEKVLEVICNRAKENKDVIDALYLGISEFSDSSIKYKIRIWCDPTNRYTLERFVNHIIKEEIVNNKIVIPFNQLDVNTK